MEQRTGAGRQAFGWVQRVAEANLVRVTTSLTCVMILLTGPTAWYVAIAVSAVAALLLIFPRLADSPAPWAYLGTALGASALYSWESADNHKYLLAYWCYLIMVSRFAHDTRAYMVRYGRWLVGACFAFAVYWKLRTSDFMTGDFFRVQLFSDSRFHALARWLGGVPAAELHEFQRMFQLLATLPSLEGVGVDLPVSQRVEWIATAMTWWALLIESTVAVGFLLPDRVWLGRWRDAALIVFILSTYPIATVMGFGLLLATIGFCQARSANVRWVYLIAFFAMFFFKFPVAHVSDGVDHLLSEN